MRLQPLKYRLCRSPQRAATNSPSPRAIFAAHHNLLESHVGTKGKFRLMRRTILLSFAGAVIFCAAISGCSKSSNETGSQTPQAPQPTKVVDQTTAATITGTVKLDGDPPQFRPLNMAAEPTCVQD